MMHADWMDVVAVVVLGCWGAAWLVCCCLGCAVSRGAVERHGVVPEDGEGDK